MRIVDLSMTVDECPYTPFAPEEVYFKARPIVRWEDKGFVSNMVVALPVKWKTESAPARVIAILD